MKDRKINWMKVTATLALTIIIFVSGLYLGTLITKGKVNDIINLEKEANLELENIAIESMLLEENPCFDPALLSEKLNDLGSKLTYLEAQYKKNDPKILELKKPYTLLEVRHYLAMKRMVEQCSYNYTLILFFYSNTPEHIDESEKQGFVLDYLQKLGNVKVYSFDSDLNLGIIRILKGMNSVTIVPSTVINGKVYAGFHDKDELIKILNK